jgi:phosphoserine aminotransferase
MLATGGLQSMAEVNRQKSELLYNYIDNESDGFYYAPVAKKHRSRMNVVFRIRHPKSSVEFNGGLEKLFAKEADSLAGLSQLSGHRSVGGLRASIYNAMSIAGVHALVDFMREFKLRNSA